MSADIGVIGLAVMGQNLTLNMNDHGFKVVAYNRTTAKVTDFLQHAAKGTNIVGAYRVYYLNNDKEYSKVQINAKPDTTLPYTIMKQEYSRQPCNLKTISMI